MSTSGISTISPPTKPAVNDDLTIIFINQDPPGWSSGQKLLFPPGPATARQILADARQKLESKGYRQPDDTLVDVEVPLAGYDIRDVGSLITSGNLEAEAKWINSPPYYSLKALDALVAALGSAEYKVTGDTNIDGAGVKRRMAFSGMLNPVAKLGEVPAGAYEVRRLNIDWPGMGPGSSSFLFLWFKSTTAGTDLFYPIFDYPDDYLKTRFQQGTLYAFPDFIATLRATALKLRLTRVADTAKQAVASVANETKQAIITVESEHKATSSEDTTTTRLKGLQAALDATLLALKQLPAPFFEKPISDVIRSQAEAAQGLAYVMAHPDSDALDQHNSVRLWGSFGMAAASLLTPRIMSVGEGNTATSLTNAAEGLSESLTFLGYPQMGRPMVGEMGGSRDIILRDLGTAIDDFVVSTQNYAQTLHPGSTRQPGGWTPAKAPIYALAHSGSIAGTVAVVAAGNSAGSPSANTIILCGAVDSLNYGMQSPGERASGPIQGAIPVTVSDDAGGFEIKNLPEGYYVLGAGQDWVVVVVKADSETKLATPLLTPPFAKSGGGG